MTLSRKVKDLTGQVFGRLKVKGYAGVNANGQTKWLCVCGCGETCIVRGDTLTSGQRSCRCLQREVAANTGKESATHGHTKEGKWSPEYHAWNNMLNRAENRNGNSPAYTTVHTCRRWLKFEDFLTDMGTRLSLQHSLGRILDRGNYEPGNAFWMTKAEQGLARRNNNALRKWERKKEAEVAA